MTNIGYWGDPLTAALISKPVHRLRFPKSAASFSKSQKKLAHWLFSAALFGKFSLPHFQNQRLRFQDPKKASTASLFSASFCACVEKAFAVCLSYLINAISEAPKLWTARAHTLVLSTLLQHFNQTPVRSEDLKTRYEEHLSICNSKIIPLFTCFHQMLFKKSKAFSKLFRQIGHSNRGGTYWTIYRQHRLWILWLVYVVIVL